MQHAIQIAAEVPQIVAVRQLAKVQWQIFAADVVKLSKDRALHDGPKTLNRVRMRRAELFGKHNPFDVGNRMVDLPMHHEIVELPISGVFVRRHKRTLEVYRFAREGFHIVGSHFVVLDHLCLDPAATFNHTYNWRLACAASARRRRVVIAPVFLSWLAAKIGFVHLDKAAEKFPVVLHHAANAVHHRPDSRAAHFQIASGLHRSQSLFRVQHERDQQKPPLQIDVRIVKDGSDRCAERPIAGPALQAIRPRGFVVPRNAVSAAVDACEPFGPSDLFKMGYRRLFGREAAINLDKAGHRLSSRLALSHPSSAAAACTNWSERPRQSASASSNIRCCAFSASRSFIQARIVRSFTFRSAAKPPNQCSPCSARPMAASMSLAGTAARMASVVNSIATLSIAHVGARRRIDSGIRPMRFVCSAKFAPYAATNRATSTAIGLSFWSASAAIASGLWEAQSIISSASSVAAGSRPNTMRISRTE